jgi:hypothetical protein
MRTSLTLLTTVAASRKNPFLGMQARARARCALVACALSLAGCAQAYSDYTESVPDRPAISPRRQVAKKTIPLPNQALLVVPGKPDCEAGGQQLASAAVVPPSPPSEKNADLALRIKLEYERECYRQAESRVREQLRKLQASASDTVRAVKQLEHDPR